MSNRNSLKSCVLATSSVAVIGAALSVSAAAPALAQEASDRVVVTGSRIARRDFQANSPLVTVDTATFENTSTVGIETVLNQLPQFIPAAFTQFTSGAVEPNPYQTPGASNVNLRGLGVGRTLTLVNGRRAVPLNALMVTDTNSIPSAAIQRVEIISGGASAVYGADAMAGVVNFILKDNYEGLTIDTQYGMTELGDNKEFRISGLFGANLANGRGNVTLGVEHSTRGYASWFDRDWWLAQVSDPTTTTNGEFWFSETYFSPGPWAGRAGGVGSPSQAAVDSIFPELPPGSVSPGSAFYINPTSDGTGTIFTGGLIFLSAPHTPGTPAGLFGNNATGGYKYNGPTVHPDYPDQLWRKQRPNGEWVEMQQANYISTPLERYSMFGSADFDLNDNITAFVSATFARTRTNTLLQFSPANNGWGVSIPYGTEIYAPSLLGNGDTHTDYLAGGRYGLDCPATGGCTNSQVFPVPAELAVLLDSRPDPNEAWHLSRNLDFLPPRQTENRSTTFQIIAGFEGRLANNWFWDVAVSHGQAESLIQSVGFGSLGAYRAIASSPNYGRNFFYQQNRQLPQPGQGTDPFNYGTFAAGSASCTTGLPLIQDFVVTPDCITAVSRNMQETSLMRQTTVDGNITGDLFALPAGDVGFALGASYRENEYEFRTDPMKDIGNIVDQAIGIFPAGSTKGGIQAAEIYGELLVPIVRDLPFIQHLELELGGRYSDYNVTGSVLTYKALLDWGVTSFARVRGGYNRASRAPNIGELFQSRTTQAFPPAGVAPAQGDPCAVNNTASPVSVSTGYQPPATATDPNPAFRPPSNQDGAAGIAHARAICEALMGPGAAVYYGQATPPAPGANGAVGDASQVLQVGNPFLDPEVADTWTVGLVLTSPFEQALVRGLRLSVDYFQIKVTDWIGNKPMDLTYQECLGLNSNPTGSILHPSCQALQRSPSNGTGIFAEAGYTNTGTVKMSGIDVQVDWSAQLADLGLGLPGGVALNVLATIPVEVRYTNPLGVVSPNYVGYNATPVQGVSAGHYKYRVFSTLNYFTGPWNASLRWQHYPSIDFNPTTVTAAGVVQPSAYNLFALTGGYWVTDNVLIRAGIENLFNKKPPLSGGNPNQANFASPPTRGGGGTYDPFGRRFFAGANVSF